MANRRQSIKKIRVDIRRRERNKSVMSELKTHLRKLQDFIQTKKIDDAKKQASVVYSKLDKAVKKNILHKNRASRTKSRISKRILRAA
jgi:small subunit ribosomal protein S20